MNFLKKALGIINLVVVFLFLAAFIVGIVKPGWIIWWKELPGFLVGFLVLIWLCIYGSIYCLLMRALGFGFTKPANPRTKKPIRAYGKMSIKRKAEVFDTIPKPEINRVNEKKASFSSESDKKQKQPVTEQKDGNEHPECAKCGQTFKWDEAYKCQDTPGAMPYTPNGYGDDVARVFCPHCGAIVVQWHITSERDYNEWAWFDKNATVNKGRPLPPSPITYWGIGIPSHIRPNYHEEGLDIEKIQKYYIDKKTKRQNAFESEKKSIEKDDIDWSKVSNYYEFARTLELKGDCKGAEKAYSLAIKEKTSNSVAACNGLGQLLEKQERYDEAIEILKKATVDYPDNGIAFQNLAFLLIKLDRLKEAEAIYEKAMKIAPRHPITNSIRNRLAKKL